MNQPPQGSYAWLGTERLASLVTAELKVTAAHVDADLRIVACTPGLPDYLVTGEGLLGRPLVDLFPELIGHQEDLAGIARGRVPRFELPKINRTALDSAGLNYLSLTVLPHPEVRGHLVLLVQDVTGEGRLEQQMTQSRNELGLLRAELEAANRKLLRLNEKKSEFLRIASHDLRNSLTVISGYAEYGARIKGSRTSEKVRHCLDMIRDRTEWMTNLIDDLLDVEKIESGEVALRQESVDLALLVERVGQSFLLVAQQGGLALAWTVPAGIAPLLGDEDRLMEVLNNLVSNAIKFTPAGGRVDLLVLDRGKEVVVEVSDTGFGISEEDQARLFQQFFRSANVRERGIPGSGLGLPIARAIVEQHGGQIYCRSRLGEGSTFGFSLPRRVLANTNCQANRHL